MNTPIMGGLIKDTVGKVVGRLLEEYIPTAMSKDQRSKLVLDAERLAIEEYKTIAADIDSARTLAAKEAMGAPSWTQILTVIHRPLWSIIILLLFSWTILSGSFGYSPIVLDESQTAIMKTVIIFYFGGRSIEKTSKIVWG